MRTSQPRPARDAFLAAIIVSTIAACDPSGSPLAPVDGDGARVAHAREGNTGGPAAMSRKPMMTREEARRKGIEHARAALARARSGATTSISDGRRLSGPDAVLHWERTLHALETGSSLWLASQSVASDEGSGYVEGSTSLTRLWSAAVLDASTTGVNADFTTIGGTVDITLSRTSPGGWSTTKIVSGSYFSQARGDYVSTQMQIDWDYNWWPDFGIAESKHVAWYGDFPAETGSSDLL